MSIVTRPHIPRASEPGRDDDPTGVHALLSALPHPDPMPEHLVERINASLAAEQAQRAPRMENGPVSPMVAGRAHRRTRLVFGVAGAAAAVVLVAVVTSISFSGSQTSGTSISAAIASTSSSGGDAAEAAPNPDATPSVGRLDSKSQPDLKASASAASRGGLSAGGALGGTEVSPGVSALRIRQSGARYTQADFLAQAVSLHQAAVTSAQFQSAANVGPASTTDWLRECMSAIGASGIQLVEADIAFYEGRPAVIIVGMANGAPLAYVVAPQCSHVHPAILRPATSLS